MGVVSSVTLQYALEDESACQERVTNEFREVWGKQWGWADRSVISYRPRALTFISGCGPLECLHRNVK